MHIFDAEAWKHEEREALIEEFGELVSCVSAS